MDDRRKTGSLDDRRSDIPLRKPRTLRTVWAIRIALGCFLIVTAVVILLRTGILTPAATIQVPVSSGPIKAGQIIETAHIGYVTLKKDQQAADWIMDTSNILGRTATSDIPEKKAFRETTLSPKAAPGSSSNSILDGWVAVIADPHRVEAPLHLMSAGTTVGILAAREGAIGSEVPPVTLISRRAIILSLPQAGAAQPDPNTRRGAAPGSASSTSGLVLQMPPEDAVRFVKAHKEGRIHLVLLGPSGADKLTSLPDPGLKQATETVEVIRGTRRSVETPGGAVEPQPAGKPAQEDQ